MGLLRGMVSLSPRNPPSPQTTFENRELGRCRNGSLSTFPTGFHASSSVWAMSTSDCPGHTLFGRQGPRDNTSAPFPGILSITFWIVFPLESLSVLYMMTLRFHVSFCSKPTLVIPHDLILECPPPQGPSCSHLPRETALCPSPRFSCHTLHRTLSP